MKSLLFLVLIILNLYLAFDLILYYTDCDILNVAPNDNIYEILAFILSCSTLYYMNKK
nr:MAG TPA: hypothetical protein [Caudoviricetes sp.]